MNAAESKFIRSQAVGRLATVSEAGAPQVTPVCFAFDGTTFYIALDEKPKRVPLEKLARVQNILRNDSVALIFDHYEDDWSRLAWVQVHGRALLIESGEPFHARAISLLRERYSQYRSMALEGRPVIAISVTSTSSWGAL